MFPQILESNQVSLPAVETADSYYATTDYNVKAMYKTNPWSKDFSHCVIGAFSVLTMTNRMQITSYHNDNRSSHYENVQTSFCFIRINWGEWLHIEDQCSAVPVKRKVSLYWLYPSHSSRPTISVLKRQRNSRLKTESRYSEINRPRERDAELVMWCCCVEDYSAKQRVKSSAQSQTDTHPVLILSVAVGRSKVASLVCVEVRLKETQQTIILKAASFE